MQNSALGSRFLRNIFSNYVRFAVTGVVGFVVTPVLFHSLPRDNYAVLIFAVSAVTILEGLDLGMFAGLVRFVGDLTARNEVQKLRQIASSAFYFILTVSLVASAALWLFSPQIVSYFRLSLTAAASTSASTVTVLGIIGLSLIFHIPGTVVRGVLEGSQEFIAANAVDVLTQLVRTSATLFLIWNGFGILAIAILYPVMALLRLCGMMIAAQLGTLQFAPAVGGASFEALKGLSGFASLSYLGDNSNWFFSQLDTFLVPRLLPLSSLAILSISRRFPMALIELSYLTLFVAYPLIATASARGEKQLMEKFLFLSVRNLLAIALPVSVALFVGAEQILRFWIGPEVLGGVPIFRLFLVFSVFASLRYVPLTYLYGIGRIGFSTTVSVVQLLVGIGVGAWACIHWGLMGLAIAFAVLQGLGTILITIYAAKAAGVTMSLWVRKSVFPPMIAVIVPVILFYPVWSRIHPTLLTLVIFIIAGTVLFVATLSLILSGSEKIGWRRRMNMLLYEVD